MKESILNINLAKRSPCGDSQGEINANLHGLNNRAKIFAIVAIGMLMEAFCHQASLLVFNGTVNSALDLETPT